MTHSGVSNRELLNQLYAVAAGVRDFAVPGARLELAQLVVEVKDELLLVNANTKARKGERDSLPFSDAYLDRKFTLAKLPGSSGKRSKNSSQSPPCSTGGVGKVVRKEAGKRRAIRVSGKRMSVKQMLRALALEKRVLPDAAVAQVMAAKKQHEAARSKMTELLDEIRNMEHENYDDLPSYINKSWIAAHAKQFHKSFDLHCTILRHLLIGSITTSKGSP